MPFVFKVKTHKPPPHPRISVGLHGFKKQDRRYSQALPSMRSGLFERPPRPMMPFYRNFIVRVEVPVRFVGFALLVAGFLLCLSIAWAAIGFFSMAFGLIFLLVAEHQRKNASYLDLTKLDSSLPIASPIITEFIDRRNELIVERDYVPQRENSWESLVASDEELSQAVNLLSPLGRQYVDQLAKMYLTYKSKAYLPVILKMILEAAQADADLLDLNGSVAGALPRSPIEEQLSHLPKTPEHDVSYKAISEAHDPIEGNPSGPHDAVFASVPPLLNDGVDDNLRDLLRRLDLTPGNRR